MKLSDWEGRHVRIKERFGETFQGVAGHCSADYCMHEYGIDEECLLVGGCLIRESDILSVEEVEVHGTAELWTEYLILRRFLPDDAPDLHKEFGADAAFARYGAQNPFATPALAQETVDRYRARYDDEHFYAWAMDCDDVLFGAIGAWGFRDGEIQVGLAVIPPCRRRGYGSEALEAVLAYLTENEGIARVTARCAPGDEAARKTLEKAGMRPAPGGGDGLLRYEYK